MKRLRLHPFSVRAWHWFNTAVVLLLMITGIQLRAPDVEIFSSYRSAVVVHKATGFVMAASFVFWLIYALTNRSAIKQYVFRLTDLKGIIRQGQYYAFGVFIGWKNPFPATPEAKFNPLQKISYISVQFLFTPIIVVTGIFFGNILFFGGVINSIGGIRILDAIHVVVGYVFVLYLFVHVYMSTMGHTPFTHIKAMFTGYEEEPD
jgi:thiosulfate reductase cytochrome b subunit